jgi:hypothetical protein
MEHKENKDLEMAMSSVKAAVDAASDELITMFSNRFPHVSGDGSSNELEYKAWRQKTLRSLNDVRRKVECDLGLAGACRIEVNQKYRIRDRNSKKVN